VTGGDYTFHAPRAALLHAGERAIGSHGTIIGRFGDRFVKAGPLSSELGRAINQAQALRTEADYGPKQLDPALVREVVSQAGQFVTAVRTLIAPE